MKKREDLVQMFSQIINKGPETRKYTSVEPQQESKTSVNKRDNSAKKNLQYYKNAADNESDTDDGSISST